MKLLNEPDALLFTIKENYHRLAFYNTKIFWGFVHSLQGSYALQNFTIDATMKLSRIEFSTGAFKTVSINGLGYGNRIVFNMRLMKVVLKSGIILDLSNRYGGLDELVDLLIIDLDVLRIPFMVEVLGGLEGG